MNDLISPVAAELVDFSFSYSSSSAIYILDVTAQGEVALPKATQTSIESVLEAELNRRIMINITFNLKPKVTNTPKPSDVVPAPDIYKP